MSKQRVQTIVLWLAMIASVAICAAGSYEHTVIVPKWTTAPPASIAMFSGPYAIDTGQWWRVVHAPALLLTISALALLWNDPRRRFVATATIGYLIILGVTAFWILPELTALTTDPRASILPAEWKRRADRWEMLSLVRLGIMYTNSLFLICAAYIPHDSKVSTSPVAQTDSVPR